MCLRVGRITELKSRVNSIPEIQGWAGLAGQMIFKPFFQSTSPLRVFGQGESFLLGLE